MGTVRPKAAAPLAAPKKPPRKPLKRSDSLRRSAPKARNAALKQGSKRTAVKRVSDKTLAKKGDRTACIAAVKLRSGGTCEALPLWPHTCWGGMDTHEVVTRGRGGDETDPENCLYVCRYSHTWAHTHQPEATRRGLLRSAGPMEPRVRQVTR